MDVMEWAENKVEHLDPVDLALIIKYVRLGPHARAPEPATSGPLPIPQPTYDAPR